jgi:hypothetical protein
VNIKSEVNSNFTVTHNDYHAKSPIQEAPPPENTDCMFSVRLKFFGRKDCKGLVTNSTNFYN